MATIDPAQLKADAETLVKDAETVLQVIEDLPLPEQVKAFIAKAEVFVKDVDAFLSA
ncbi:hypothetical protein [Mycobacterium avium]|uniref:hypothetical protein n=1 Tax=Mycobacterium avium TaxID=1764 RepID=UPI00045AC4D4|nr:hypothetical protein [Mycobacterium avium]KBR63534.1 hypothetical protein X425_02363 [Mycobacterium avium XTB13-223]